MHSSIRKSQLSL